MPLSLAHPWWLLALLAVPVLVAVAAGRARTDRHLRRATAVRALGVAALVLALAAPRYEASGGDLDLVVLVDGSDSTAAFRAAAETWIGDAVTARGGRDRVAVAAVGRDAQVEHALRVDPPGDPLSVRVDGTETDLARGLRLAQGLAGSEQRRRVVVLTDGRPTRGDTAAAIAELRTAGIAVDVVPLGDGVVADVLVEAVAAPSQVRDGDAYEVVVHLGNSTGAEAGVELEVTASGGPDGDGEVVLREAVRVPPGGAEVVVPRVADRDGTTRYEARITSAVSSETRNDVGVAAVQVAGPASVLLVEGATGDATELAARLEAGGLPTTTIDATSDGFPTLDRLLDHDAAVLVDVDAERIGEAGAVALDAYVRDAGRGLTVVGGERSYGLGGYDGTAVEELLPVFARIQDPQRRPSVAQALVVDVSGSMGACHCRPDGFGGGPQMVEGGVNKTDISREAVARAIDNLDAQDTVGVLAFHTRAEWVLPLQSVPERAIVEDALATLHPEGDTTISTGVREAIEGLKDADARLRHIVLFTDGFTNEGGLEQVAREAADAGITLSVVGTGEGAGGPDDTGHLLERMAEAGGGRYYPGRDLSSIPSVLASEVQLVARPLIEEGQFLPVVAAADPVVDRLESSPPLLGYVATTAKPTARTLLRIGDERDPLLATWQAGLGTVAAWTSDATTRWSSGWSGWDGARDLWAGIVRSTLPGDDGGNVEVSASVAPDGLRIDLAATETLPADVEVTATITDPDGTRREVPVPRRDLEAFSATVPAGAEGIHAVTVTATRGDTEVARRTVTAIRSYPAEYAAHAQDADAVARLAELGGGMLDPTAADAFRRGGTTPGRTPIDLTPWLLAIALLTVPVDVGLRRLRLERGDLGRLIGRARRPAATPARPNSSPAAPATTVAPPGRRATSPPERDPDPAERDRDPAERDPVPAERDPDPPAPPPQPAPAADGAGPGVDGPPPPPASGAAALLEARRRARERGEP
ncbi:VWA domain-containing protein [Nitriliruptoraceae bacterium ZYF776]|nr:VWA domain-containing protein [Profundirhabdus halotolerans]